MQKLKNKYPRNLGDTIGLSLELLRCTDLQEVECPLCDKTLSFDPADLVWRRTGEHYESCILDCPECKGEFELNATQEGPQYEFFGADA